MVRRTFLAALFVAALVAPAAAQPPTVTALSANPSRSMNFSWLAASGATWYYLWVTDSSGVPRHRMWYTASQLNCAAGQSPLCQINAPIYLLPGEGTWWVQTYSESGGYGAWTAAQAFSVPGPLFAVVDWQVRGNAVKVTWKGTGRWEVELARDVRNCAFMTSISGVGQELYTGVAHGTTTVQSCKKLSVPVCTFAVPSVPVTRSSIVSPPPPSSATPAAPRDG